MFYISRPAYNSRRYGPSDFCSLLSLWRAHSSPASKPFRNISRSTTLNPTWVSGL